MKKVRKFLWPSLAGLFLTALVLSSNSLSLPVLAGPMTYYVDQNHPSASDANPGSATQPWLTIAKAAEVASAGDTIVIKPGTYPERIQPQNSGAPGLPITFLANPRRSVTMFGFYTQGSDYLRLEGFNIITDPSLTGWTERYGVFIRSDHVEVVDNYFEGLKSTAIQGYWHAPYPRNAYVAGNHIYLSQMGLGITGYDWLVENNEVERLFKFGGGDSDYSRFFGDNHVIRGNKFHGMKLSEIGSAHVDCFQTFDNNGEFSHNVVIEGNWCQDFHQGFMGEAHYYRDISHLTFKNNVFVHGWAWGLAVQDISYVKVYNNTFVDIQHHGVGFSGPGAHHADIQNNIFYDTGTSYWFPENSNSSGDHNLIYNSSSPPAPGPHDLDGLDPNFVDLNGDDFRLKASSPAKDAGTPLPTVNQDLRGFYRPYGNGWDVGAYELHPDLVLGAGPGDETIFLSWKLNITLPLTATWEIDYQGPPGIPPSPVTGIASYERTYLISGLQNDTWYTVTLQASTSGSGLLSDTVRARPTSHHILLPSVP